MPQSTVFSNFKKVYRKLLEPPSMEYTHPYVYITEQYGKTFNSKQTGLPGYTPPFPIRFFNTAAYIAKYIQFIIGLLAITVVLLSLCIAFFRFFTSVSFTYTSFFGQVITEVPQLEFTFRLTPLVFFGALYIISTITTVVLDEFSYLLSRPYEKEYEQWLETLRPTNDAYPPSVQYTLSQETKTYTELQKTAPKAAPPPFQEPTLFDKFFVAITTILFVYSWQMSHLLGEQTPWSQKNS